jgi:hypothetical protein
MSRPRPREACQVTATKGATFPKFQYTSRTPTAANLPWPAGQRVGTGGRARGDKPLDKQCGLVHRGATLMFYWRIQRLLASLAPLPVHPPGVHLVSVPRLIKGASVSPGERIILPTGAITYGAAKTRKVPRSTMAPVRPFAPLSPRLAVSQKRAEDSKQTSIAASPGEALAISHLTRWRGRRDWRSFRDP